MLNIIFHKSHCQPFQILLLRYRWDVIQKFYLFHFCRSHRLSRDRIISIYQNPWNHKAFRCRKIWKKFVNIRRNIIAGIKNTTNRSSKIDVLENPCVLITKISILIRWIGHFAATADQNLLASHRYLSFRDKNSLHQNIKTNRLCDQDQSAPNQRK